MKKVYKAKNLTKHLTISILALGLVISTALAYQLIGNAPKTAPIPSANTRVLFITHSETVGGKGVLELYEEMKNLGIEVKIAVIPYFYNNKRNKILDVDESFAQKFPEEDVIYPCGKKPPYHKPTDINPAEFDWVFTQNPYFNEFHKSILDPTFMLANLKKQTKVAYIVYGPHIFHQNYINSPELNDYIDAVFVDSESTEDIYLERYKIDPEKIVVSGYIPYREIRERAAKHPGKQARKTVLWLPRWKCNFEHRDLYEGGSTFMNYVHFFYTFAKTNPDIDFIIRPHLHLYKKLVEEEHMSQEDLDAIISKFESLPNVRLSNHKKTVLLEDIFASDIVVSDGSSSLAEVVLANKPIIYLSNGWNNEFNSNELSKGLKEIVSLAYSPKELKKMIYKTPKPDKETLSAFKAKLDPVENPARFIAEYIYQDSKKDDVSHHFVPTTDSAEHR